MSRTMEPDLDSPLGAHNEPAHKEWKHPSDQWLRGFVLDNRASLGTLAVFIVMMAVFMICLLYTSPSPRDRTRSRMPSSA